MRSFRIVLACLLVSTLGRAQSDKVHSIANNIVITHVTVINPQRASDLHDQTVVIEGDKILQMGASSRVKIPDSAQVVEGRNKFLIPGLWDMHVHVDDPQRDLPMFIANGVLGIRNMGGVEQNVFQWRAQTASGEVLGPKMVACGPLLDGPFPSHPEHAISVHNAQEGRAAVDKLHADGADFIKIYDGLSRESYFAIVKEAKKDGIPFVGHVPLSVRASEASIAGQKSIEHLTGVLQGDATNEDEILKETADNSVFAEAMKTHNYSLIPEHIARVWNSVLDHYSERKARALYQLFIKNGTWQVPTLVIERSITFVDQISKEDDPRLKYMPENLRESWKPENGMLTRYRTPAYIAYRKREYLARIREVRLMHSMGVPIMAGTDTNGAYLYPGFSLHDELRLFVQAGFTPREALASATVKPAEFFGTLGDEGTIEKGKVASLVLLDADPTTDINNVDKISTVIYRGKIYDRAALDAMLKHAEELATEGK